MLAILVLAGCASEATQVIVEIDATDELRVTASRLVVDIIDTEGVNLGPDVYDLSTTEVQFPIRIALVPKPVEVSGNQDRTWMVQASAYESGATPVASDFRRGEYFEGERRVVSLLLDKPDISVEPVRLPPGGSFLRVEIAPSDPDTIYVKTIGEQVFRTRNGALTFEACQQNDIQHIAVSPTNAAHLIVSRTEGISVSTDGCSTFTSIRDVPSGAVHMVSDEIWLAGNQARGAHRFVDGVWTVIDDLEECTVRRFDSDPAGLVVAVATIESGVLISEDQGLTWSQVTGEFGRGEVGATNISVNAADPNYILVQGDDYSYRTEDRGRTWQQLHRNGLAIATNPLDPGCFVVSVDRDIRFSNNGGANETNSRRGSTIGRADVHDAAFHPSTPGLLYAATGRGLFRIELGPTCALPPENPPWVPVHRDMSQWTVREILSHDGSTYIATSAGIWRSDDGARSFRSVSAGRGSGDLRDLAIEGGRTFACGNSILTREGLPAPENLDFVAAADGGFRNCTGLHDFDENIRFVSTRSSIFESVAGEDFRSVTINGSNRFVSDVLAFDGVVWVATENGPFRREESATEFQPFDVGLISLNSHVLVRVGEQLLLGTDVGVFAWDRVAEGWDLRGLLGLQIRDLQFIDGTLFAVGDDGVFEEQTPGSWIPFTGTEGKRARVIRQIGDQLFVGTDGFGIFATTRNP